MLKMNEMRFSNGDSFIILRSKEMDILRFVMRFMELDNVFCFTILQIGYEYKVCFYYIALIVQHNNMHER